MVRNLNNIILSLREKNLKRHQKVLIKIFKDIELLRYKSYSFSTPLSDDQVLKGDFILHSVEACRTLCLMNRFLNAALEKWL